MENTPKMNSVKAGIEPQRVEATPRDEATLELMVAANENAVFPSNDSELNALMETVQQVIVATTLQRIVPLEDTINYDELEATAAGLTAVGTSDGNSFVRLSRVTENVEPLSYSYAYTLPEVDVIDETVIIQSQELVTETPPDVEVIVPVAPPVPDAVLPKVDVVEPTPPTTEPPVPEDPKDTDSDTDGDNPDPEDEVPVDPDTDDETEDPKDTDPDTDDEDETPVDPEDPETDSDDTSEDSDPKDEDSEDPIEPDPDTEDESDPEDETPVDPEDPIEPEPDPEDEVPVDPDTEDESELEDETPVDPVKDNNGHGNNTDGQDDNNPGQGSGGPNENPKDGLDEDEGNTGNQGDDTPGVGTDGEDEVIEEPETDKVKENNGHGNNTDGQDDSNPGKGSGGPNLNPKDLLDEDEGLIGNHNDSTPGVGANDVDSLLFDLIKGNKPVVIADNT
jgi:hypothetical protein